MRFPRERIRFAKTVEGRSDPNGFLVLDLKGLDIEGATTFVLDLKDIDSARTQGDKQDEATRRARELLGG